MLFHVYCMWVGDLSANLSAIELILSHFFHQSLRVEAVHPSAQCHRSCGFSDRLSATYSAHRTSTRWPIAWRPTWKWAPASPSSSGIIGVQFITYYYISRDTLGCGLAASGEEANSPSPIQATEQLEAKIWLLWSRLRWLIVNSFGLATQPVPTFITLPAIFLLQIVVPPSSCPVKRRTLNVLLHFVQSWNQFRTGLNDLTTFLSIFLPFYWLQRRTGFYCSHPADVMNHHFTSSALFLLLAIFFSIIVFHRIAIHATACRTHSPSCPTPHTETPTAVFPSCAARTWRPAALPCCRTTKDASFTTWYRKRTHTRSPRIRI